MIAVRSGGAQAHLLQRGRERDPPALQRRPHDGHRGVPPPAADAGAGHHVRRGGHRSAPASTRRMISVSSSGSSRDHLSSSPSSLPPAAHRRDLRRHLRFAAADSPRRARHRREPRGATPPQRHGGRARPGIPPPEASRSFETRDRAEEHQREKRDE